MRDEGKDDQARCGSVSASPVMPHPAIKPHAHTILGR
jgi:hypothetical protein